VVVLTVFVAVFRTSWLAESMSVVTFSAVVASSEPESCSVSVVTTVVIVFVMTGDSMLMRVFSVWIDPASVLMARLDVLFSSVVI